MSQYVMIERHDPCLRRPISKRRTSRRHRAGHSDRESWRELVVDPDQVKLWRKKIQFMSFIIIYHGSLHVPIFHITQPWSVYGLLDGYYFWWCPVYPKWDSDTKPCLSYHHLSSIIIIYPMFWTWNNLSWRVPAELNVMSFRPTAASRRRIFRWLALACGDSYIRYTLLNNVIKGSLGGETSVLRTFRMSGK